MAEDTPMIGDYVLQDIIGRGTYAEVRRAVHRHTGVEVAMKIIDKTQRSMEDLRRLQMECYVQARLKHQNIVQLYEVIESDTHVFMILELARGGEVILPQFWRSVRLTFLYAFSC
jgi:serine/threonine protein kinase